MTLSLRVSSIARAPRARRVDSREDAICVVVVVVVVVVVPPEASKIIFNIDLGPSVVRMMSLTALAAAMLFARAIEPVSRLALVFITMICCP